MKDAVRAIETQFSDFAAAHIAVLPGLGNQTAFPQALWEKMGAENMLNPALFAAPGLKGSFCTAIVRAGRALVHRGGNIGMVLSWMVHHLVAGNLLFPGAGTTVQPIQTFLEPLAKAMAKGEATVCFAVSESRAGAHPKYLETTATQSKAGFTLNGEKTYLTNGPIAHAFVVIAVTGNEGGKKSFSAFLVPKDAEGLTLLPPMEIPFFKPSPHGSICLNECHVPDSSLMGRQGHAYADRVLAFRQMEDAAMTGPVTGAMAFLLDALAREMGNREKTKGEKTADALVQKLGGLAMVMETAELMSRTLAAAVDDPGHCNGPEAILLAFKHLVREYVTGLETLVDEICVRLPEPCGVLIQDLTSSARIGNTIAQIQQVKLGRALLEKIL